MKFGELSPSIVVACLLCQVPSAILAITGQAVWYNYLIAGIAIGMCFVWFLERMKP